jgi:hypothetical protein
MRHSERLKATEMSMIPRSDGSKLMPEVELKMAQGRVMYMITNENRLEVSLVSTSVFLRMYPIARMMKTENALSIGADILPPGKNVPHIVRYSRQG